MKSTDFVKVLKFDNKDTKYHSWAKGSKKSGLTSFNPFDKTEKNNCSNEAYDTKSAKVCWQQWGPNSLFHANMKSFEREFIARCKKIQELYGYKSNISDQLLTKLGCSMLGFSCDGANKPIVISFSVSASHFLAPCATKSCGGCPNKKKGTPLSECNKIVKHIKSAQGDLPFTGDGYTFDFFRLGSKGEETIGATEGVVSQHNVNKPNIKELKFADAGDYLRALYNRAHKNKTKRKSPKKS